MTRSRDDMTTFMLTLIVIRDVVILMAVVTILYILILALGTS